MFSNKNKNNIWSKITNFSNSKLKLIDTRSKLIFAKFQETLKKYNKSKLAISVIKYRWILLTFVSGVFVFLIFNYSIHQIPKNAFASGPTISSISPNSSSTSGGVEITINGTNFAQGGPQRIITITNPGSTITDYEGNFSLDTASLITAGKLRSDCGDIRVKDSDGNTDLNYWIDGNCNSVSTVVWFKKPSLVAGANTVVLRYGTPSATSQSNIANFSFGSILGGANNKLWLSANNIATSNTFTPTFGNLSGVTATGGDLINSGTANSWSNGLTSVENISSGNGFVSARMQETNTYRMFGLSKGNTDSNYTDIDFAIFPANDTSLNVYEAGTSRGSFGNYALNDVLSVEASGDKILYKKNGNVIYTSTVTLTAGNYPLLLDTSFYSTGATLKDVKMCVGICDSSNLTTWSDRSGSENDVTGSATFKNGGNGITNQPVAYFNGSQTMSKTGLTDFQFNGANIFAVSRVTTITNSSLLW